MAQVSKPSGKTAVSANHVTSSSSAVTGLKTTKAANTKATKGTAKSKGKGKSGVGQKGGKLVSSTSTVMTSAAAPSSQAAKPQFVVKNEPGNGGVVKLMKEEAPASPVQQKSPSRLEAVTSSVASPAVAASSSSSSLSTDELVRLQQKQIEELKSQLADTQQQLSHADKQAQLHQEQLRKLAIAKIATLSQQNALNALLAEQARTQKQIQALAQAHNAQLSQLTQQSLEIAGVPGSQSKTGNNSGSNKTPTPIIVATNNHLLATSGNGAGGDNLNTAAAAARAQNLTSLLQAQGLQNVNLSQTKIVQVINASGQPQFVLTSQPSSSSKTTQSATVVSGVGAATTASAAAAQALLATRSVSAAWSAWHSRVYTYMYGVDVYMSWASSSFTVVSV